MTEIPVSNTELKLIDLDPRASALLRSLGARKMRRGPVAYYVSGRRVEQFRLLYAAGFWPCRRGGLITYRRDPRPLNLYGALAVARAMGGSVCGTQAVCSLTANSGSPTQNTATD